jgi:hypothetical protein
MTATHQKHLRAYINGVDVSGYSRAIGPLTWMAEVSPEATWTDGVKNVLIGQCDIQAGPLNAVLDNDAAGLFTLTSAGTGQRNLLLAVGVGAAPVLGNPMFAWQFEQTAYTMEPGAGFVAANIPFGGATFNILNYHRPWGHLLHASAAETAVNTAIGADDIGASSALGGIFCYQLLTSNGTVTLKAQHAATNSNGSFSDLTGATSGSITAAVTPQSGMVALSTSLSISRYTRWQLVFGTATTATFVMGLIRNNL